MEVIYTKLNHFRIDSWDNEIMFVLVDGFIW